MLPKTKMTTITLSQWEKNYNPSTSSLYVLNVSDDDADLLFSVTGDNNRSISVSIPFSFAPIDLTVFAPADLILRSESFRRFLAAGYLVIGDNDQVEKEIMPIKEVKQELARINLARATVPDEDQGKVSLRIGRKRATDSATEEYVHPSEDPLVNMLILAAEEQDDAQINNLLVTRGERLTEEQCEYLRSISTHTAITEYVIERLRGEEEIDN